MPTPFTDEATALKTIEVSGLPSRVLRTQQVRSCRCAGYDRCSWEWCPQRSEWVGACGRVTQYSCPGATYGGRVQFSTAAEAVTHLATREGFHFVQQQTGSWIWEVALQRMQRQQRQRQQMARRAPAARAPARARVVSRRQSRPATTHRRPTSTSTTAQQRRYDGEDGPFSYQEFVAYYGQAGGNAAWSNGRPATLVSGGPTPAEAMRPAVVAVATAVATVATVATVAATAAVETPVLTTDAVSGNTTLHAPPTTVRRAVRRAATPKSSRRRTGVRAAGGELKLTRSGFKWVAPEPEAVASTAGQAATAA